MPRNLFIRARKHTVKRALTPQTPADWLLNHYERQVRQRRHGLLCDAAGDPTVHIQPMFTFKPLIPDDDQSWRSS